MTEQFPITKEHLVALLLALVQKCSLRIEQNDEYSIIQKCSLRIEQNDEYSIIQHT